MCGSGVVVSIAVSTLSGRPKDQVNAGVSVVVDSVRESQVRTPGLQVAFPEFRPIRNAHISLGPPRSGKVVATM